MGGKQAGSSSVMGPGQLPDIQPDAVRVLKKDTQGDHNNYNFNQPGYRNQGCVDALFRRLRLLFPAGGSCSGSDLKIGV